MTFNVREVLNIPAIRTGFFKDNTGSVIVESHSSPSTVLGYDTASVLTSGSGKQTILEVKNGVIDFLTFYATGLGATYTPHCWITVDDGTTEEYTESLNAAYDNLTFIHPQYFSTTDFHFMEPIYFSTLKIEGQMDSTGNVYFRYRYRAETFVSAW